MWLQGGKKNLIIRIKQSGTEYPHFHVNISFSLILIVVVFSLFQVQVSASVITSLVMAARTVAAWLTPRSQSLEGYPQLTLISNSTACLGFFVVVVFYSSLSIFIFILCFALKHYMKLQQNAVIFTECLTKNVCLRFCISEKDL